MSLAPVPGARAPGFPLGLLRASGRALQRLPRARAPLAVLAWCALVFWLSSLRLGTTGASSAWRGYAGNLFHAFEYGVLALLCALALPRAGGWPDLRARNLLAIVCFCGLYGASDELHQAFVPGRSSTPLDVLTDLVGASGVLLVAAWAGRPEADARGLRLRLALALCASLAAAALSTWSDWSA